MKKLTIFILGMMILVPVLLVVTAIWLWRVIGKDIFKFVYETGETAYKYLKARYDRNDAEPAESETEDE